MTFGATVVQGEVNALGREVWVGSARSKRHDGACEHRVRGQGVDFAAGRALRNFQHEDRGDALLPD